MSSRRRLILLRHAKAESFATSDSERRLTARGRSDAADAGRHLAEHGVVPDAVLVSSAARAQETWRVAADSAGMSAPVTVDEAVYAGSPDVVLEALRRMPAEAGAVMFVGHNPTVATLAQQLDDGSGEPSALHSMLAGYPTAALTIFEVEVAWQDLAPETGRVVDFYVARG